MPAATAVQVEPRHEPSHFSLGCRGLEDRARLVRRLFLDLLQQLGFLAPLRNAFDVAGWMKGSVARRGKVTLDRDIGSFRTVGLKIEVVDCCRLVGGLSGGFAQRGANQAAVR